jgi:hypothetical protein
LGKQTELVPYRVREASGGARHLIVGFPKLHPGAVPPSRRLFKTFDDVNAHLLSLGADENIFIGPRRQGHGLDAAVQIIRDQARRLDVPRENVVAIGTSMGAICALTIGLHAGCGRVIAGGPPVLMGRWLQRLAELDGPAVAAKAAAKEMLALADNGDRRPDRYLDYMAVEAAREAPDPTHIEVFVSLVDHTYPAVRWFRRRVAKMSHIQLQITHAEYARHVDIKDAFDEHVRGVLAGLCGLRAAA